ncbi:cytochrome P450 CYP18A1 [Apostichopus japonicus]|uniref:Cytochrome P450 CYP18A1 n=1 Tax=Stichopus japonicus TaxID=307972 RepID=A0A2G8KW10_STIJA|nr:cytochrome P450 CYP18A1 [Apostichopus japonicus]
MFVLCLQVYEEVISVIGDSRLPTFEDMKQMPYTHAFLQEALRFRSAVPFGTREAARDVIVGGYTIPKGSNILVNYWAVERDPDVWNKPEEFRPERFLGADKKTPVDLPHHIPLGVGHRNCLGQTLALMEMFLFSTNLLQKFRLEFSPSDPKPPLRGVSGATVVVENFKLCAKKR